MNELVISVMWLLHLGATLFMTGVIWMVQLVHYPLFGSVGRQDFPTYAARHVATMTWVVGPAMLMEGTTAILMFWFRPDSLMLWYPLIGLCLLLVIWSSTAFVQVPCHESLVKGFNSTTHHRLVRTNWLRTLAWSGRSLLFLVATALLLR